jgi:uncharacterized protein
MSEPAWLRETEDGCVLTLAVQPGAKKNEIVGPHGDALKLRLKAPPVEGKANAALLQFFAQTLGVRQAGCTLIAGDTSRAKRLHVRGLTKSLALIKLKPLANPSHDDDAYRAPTENSQRL